MIDQARTVKGYDLIGDVHGCAQTLVQLLERLGYEYRSGCYRHPERQAVFIGDIVDRGNHIREALEIVRDMTEAGAAEIVLGNHEYNAIVYCTKNADGSDYLREHNDRHFRQIEQTIEQFANYGQDWKDYLNWFRTIPLFLEKDHFRAVHACWDEVLVSGLKEQGIIDFSDDAFLYDSVNWGTFASKVADRLLRGTYLVLPDNEVMQSRDGFRRRSYRTKFWFKDPQTHNDLVFQPDPLPEHIGYRDLTEKEKQRVIYYGKHLPPLFIGHYWQSGEPQPITSNIACLDYSAVKRGRLVAYRMDAEQYLDPSKFVWVRVDERDIDDII